MKPTILVIGSNSFAGSNLIKYLLKKNHKVLAVSRSKEINKVFLPYKWNSKNRNKVKFHKININHNSNKLIYLIKKYKIKHIVNFAAQGMVEQSWQNPSHWYQTNLISQVKFLQELMKLKFIKKYIQFSTPEVYGNTKKSIKENFNFNPSTPYAISRAACDFHLREIYKNYKFPVIFTRTSNIYGPGQQLYRIVPKSFMCSITRKRIFLDGGGRSIRSFIYIEDVSEAVYKILQKGKIGNTYHIATKKLISIKNLVKKIYSITSSNYPGLVNNRKDRLGKDFAYILNTKKINHELKWIEKTPLKTGLIKTLEWINKNYSFLKKSSKNYKHKI